MNLASVLLLALASSSLSAATVAIIDTGMDYKHEQIRSNLWVNKSVKKTGKYANTLYGWNFVENNNQVIDYSHLNTFDPDVNKFYEIQAKGFLFTRTDAEKAWAQEKLKDKNFSADLDRFGSFIHGTHVAGIAVKNSANKAMGIKLLATPVKKTMADAASNLLKNQSTDPWVKLKELFKAVADKRTAEMVEISKFMVEHKVDVANGSFGTGIDQALPVVYQAFLFTFLRQPTDQELIKGTKLFLDTLAQSGKLYVAMAPKILFVFAAGNDGLSNDEIGMSPANIKADNTISVAATYKDQFFAPFSNYGTKMVEVAAPGLAVSSSIPGKGYLEVSGTSQAAPYVANVAGRVKDSNPKLTPKQIKKIIMETVDKKPFLANRVSTGGIVNAARAVMAAELSKKVSLEEAIQRANVQVVAKKSMNNFEFDMVDVQEVKPIKLPTEFSL